MASGKQSDRGNKGDREQMAIGLLQGLFICFNSRMTLPNFPIEIPESEHTLLVNWLLNLVAQQQQLIEKQQQLIEKQQNKIAFS
ncbi:MAG: hypothetical protein AB4426_18440 [Xenococcaceae cyanobacterium]